MPRIQRAGTMTAPSAVVSLQRPPPPLIFTIRTEEQEKEEQRKRGVKRQKMSERVEKKKMELGVRFCLL